MVVDNTAYTMCNVTLGQNEQNESTVNSRVEHFVDIDKMNVRQQNPN